MNNRYLGLFLLCLAFASCKPSKKEDPKAPQKLAKAVLIEPENNKVCVGGPASDGMVNIRFRWMSESSDDEFLLQIKDLISGEVLTRSTTARELSVPLYKGVPFSWNVVTRRSGESVDSDAWQFYSEGESQLTSPPFPAGKMSPEYGAYIDLPVSGIINLKWNASDPDSDISAYDIYLSTSAQPALYKKAYKNSSVDVQDLRSGKKYYWKIVTHDQKGNSSVSAVSVFTIN
ncbi:MAG: hypothetical protein INR69_00045 [Mucilaginibacter polytrichastri]|nr:hypothetical protein [Mucilaginibacter polytrichastri]